MSWSDNKELLSGADAMLKFSIKKEKKRKEKKKKIMTLDKKRKKKKKKKKPHCTRKAHVMSLLYIYIYIA